ncbi:MULTISPECIES: thiopeptide-type bacteriocin biosynthesis protein [Streptomyces]|uniref:thiopeptide-type bacteriocin biosynthesis protein n=1 Tax=Streptomyces TaxID=1883 RepID=UPI000B9E3315|nr:thiopeptide-type bacteriocin biosynthesis protein [Streptomyces kasugaensis]
MPRTPATQTSEEQPLAGRSADGSGPDRGPGTAPAPAPGGTVRCGALDLPLPRFLRAVADQLEGTDAAPPDGLLPAAEVFLGAGLPALRAADRPHAWLEYRLLTSPAATGAPHLYAALLGTVRELLAERTVEDFFFVHKTPGLRVRFQTRPDLRERAAGLLARTWDDWRARGILTGVHHAVYEPEQHLFGGPESMRSVHRVFTADSLVWLRHLSLAQPPAPVWALSMAMIRVLFTELHISDFEDRDVWDRMRWQVGRRFTGDPPAGWADTAARLRQVWYSPERLDALRGPAVEDDFAAFRESVAEICAQWRAEYFTGPGARVGPREAAAFLLVFHWNRARLPKDWQIGITEALVQGPAKDGAHDS